MVKIYSPFQKLQELEQSPMIFIHPLPAFFNVGKTFHARKMAALVNKSVYIAKNHHVSASACNCTHMHSQEQLAPPRPLINVEVDLPAGKSSQH